VPDLVKNSYAHNRKKILKGIFVHLDNACPHNSRQSCKCLKGFSAYRIPYPAYSLDLAPNDFFLSGYLKTKLAELVMRSREELISITRQIFDEIPREKFVSVDLSWKKGRSK
jgi:hypothetical protein